MNKRNSISKSSDASINHLVTNFTAEMWQLEVSLGNEFFSEERFLMALSHYHQAVGISEGLLTNYCCQGAHSQEADEQITPGAIVAMLLVSYHNLADLYLIKHEFRLAERAYQQANEQLIMALETIVEGSIMHLALLSGINRNRSILQLHQREYGKTTKPLQSDICDTQQILFCRTLRNIQ